MKPIIIINFKAYKKTGDAIKLAKICNSIKNKKYDLILAVQTADLYRIASSVRLKVIAQHFDAIKKGQFTGHVLPETLKSAKAYGSLLNHSEHRSKFKVLKKSIEIAKKLKLKTIVCCKNIREARKIARLRPYALAFEDPKLVASGVSISKTEPRRVKKFVKVVRKINKNVVLLCGAGISNRLEVISALNLGTRGVIISSAVATAKNPRKVLKEILK